MIAVQQINLANRAYYNDALLNFEKLFRYPLGDDYFTIDHGADYFKFFDLLGTPYCFIAQEDGVVVGVCMAVLRNVSEKIWYLCDFKVHQNYQGRFIAHKILKHVFATCSAISKKVYAISMNNNSSLNNRIVEFAKRIPYLRIELQAILDFYLLDKSNPDALKFIKTNQFISLTGIKDLVLASSGKLLNFMHCVGQPACNTIEADMRKELMVCCVQSSQLANDFKKWRLRPMASASVIANFTPLNWDFIKSCDI